MANSRAGMIRYAFLFAAALCLPARLAPADGVTDAARSRVEGALRTMMLATRPGQDALATVWDSNQYIQCRRAAGGAVRCEAAGALMQPSLALVLTPDRVNRLAALGWRLDPSFGNYAQTFRANISPDELAKLVLTTLMEGYGALIPELEFSNSWVGREPCPPRNGPSQNLAGMIDDAPAMAATAIHACAYTPAPAEPDATLAPPSGNTSPSALVRALGGVTREIARLRMATGGQRVFAVLDAGAGYVQCEPMRKDRVIYCEAASAESWPALAAMLTPERVALLHDKGFADPGRRQNYYRDYKIADFSDAAIARALLAILHDVYGYDGGQNITVHTEAGDRDLL